MSVALQLKARRALDLLLAFIALALLSLPSLLIALAVRLETPGPVIFRQERVGKGGRRFQILKFRTMVDGAMDMPGGLTTWRGDPRITRVGRFLRDWALDEVPQFINVLRAEMSLVGPRATVPAQVDRYGPREMRRLEVRPGMTGLTFVTKRNQMSWAERIELDLWYVDHWSLWLDLAILARTFWVLTVTREGSRKDDFLPESAAPHRDDGVGRTAPPT